MGAYVPVSGLYFLNCNRHAICIKKGRSLDLPFLMQDNIYYSVDIQQIIIYHLFAFYLLAYPAQPVVVVSLYPSIHPDKFHH